MSANSNNAQISSLRQFKRRRDALLNEDIEYLDQHLALLLKFLESDPVIRSVLSPLLQFTQPDHWAEWLNKEYAKLDSEAGRGIWEFPDDPEDEFRLQYQLLHGYANQHERNFMDLQNRRTRWSDYDGSKGLFLSLVARPFCQTLGDKLEAAIGMPSPEARELLAVPIERIPLANETRIFLSHKSENKDLVRRYHRTLSELGFKPWLDESDMPAGTELNRGIVGGINKSCAVVFFITEDFNDDDYLADEIDYAKDRKRQQGNRFAIITLRLSKRAPVPQLLTKYVYREVGNDLDGLYEIVRALPIELGPVRWKESSLR